MPRLKRSGKNFQGTLKCFTRIEKSRLQHRTVNYGQHRRQAKRDKAADATVEFSNMGTLRLLKRVVCSNGVSKTQKNIKNNSSTECFIFFGGGG